MTAHFCSSRQSGGPGVATAACRIGALGERYQHQLLPWTQTRDIIQGPSDRRVLGAHVNHQLV